MVKIYELFAFHSIYSIGPRLGDAYHFFIETRALGAYLVIFHYRIVFRHI